VEREGAADTSGALHTNSAAVRFDNLLHQTKPHTASLNLSSDRFLASVKWLEDARDISRADPLPTIFDDDLYFVCWLPG
jgi:hypothetical protein